MAEEGIWCGFKRKTVVMTCIGEKTVYSGTKTDAFKEYF
jgi:hypothetical protein